MNLLVLGGSYFLGKHFVNMASREHEVTVFNRGNRPLENPGIQEIRGDRHDSDALAGLKGKHFNAVVDFCAYQKGDIEMVLSSLGADFDQYIFISTSDVYERGLNRLLDETAPLEKRVFGGEAGAYISGKVALERELADCGARYGVKYTSIRPAFIYGPDNYAPRESMYFLWIEQAGQILHPVDATGIFQMVYVEDVARAILRALGNQAAFNGALNLAPLQMETYDSFAAALKESCEKPFELVEVTVSQALEKNLPLPFPLTREESNQYDGRKALQLIGQYTALTEGMKKTVAWRKCQTTG